METLAPQWVTAFVKRWQKRIFPNDNISYRPSREDWGDERLYNAYGGLWEIIITRGKFEASLILNPTIYGNPRTDKKVLLKADNEMRYVLKRIKERGKVE